MQFMKFRDGIDLKRFSGRQIWNPCSLCVLITTLICKSGCGVCSSQTHNYISIFLRFNRLALLLLRRLLQLLVLDVRHSGTPKFLRATNVNADLIYHTLTRPYQGISFLKAKLLWRVINLSSYIRVHDRVSFIMGNYICSENMELLTWDQIANWKIAQKMLFDWNVNQFGNGEMREMRNAEIENFI